MPVASVRLSSDGKPVAASFDWPLSREEKKKCALHLFAQDMEAANKLLEDRDAENRRMRHELMALKRSSRGSVGSLSSLGTVIAPGTASGNRSIPAEATEGMTGAASRPARAGRRSTAAAESSVAASECDPEGTARSSSNPWVSVFGSWEGRVTDGVAGITRSLSRARTAATRALSEVRDLSLPRHSNETEDTASHEEHQGLLTKSVEWEAKLERGGGKEKKRLGILFGADSLRVESITPGLAVDEWGQRAKSITVISQPGAVETQVDGWCIRPGDELIAIDDYGVAPGAAKSLQEQKVLGKRMQNAQVLKFRRAATFTNRVSGNAGGA